MLPAKLILRDLCKEKVEWDEEIVEKKAERWLSWLEDLQKLTNFSVRRSTCKFWACQDFQLHHFADASENGYGYGYGHVPLVDKRPRSKELHIHDRKVQSSATQAGYYS